MKKRDEARRKRSFESFFLSTAMTLTASGSQSSLCCSSKQLLRAAPEPVQNFLGSCWWVMTLKSRYVERITRLIRKSFGIEALMLEGGIEFKRRHCSKNPTGWTIAYIEKFCRCNNLISWTSLEIDSHLLCQIRFPDRSWNNLFSSTFNCSTISIKLPCDLDGHSRGWTARFLHLQFCFEPLSVA